MNGMKSRIILCLLSVAGLFTLSVSAGTANRVDVYPQCFESGGWKLDVQFMDIMGSPYLLAHGCGIRVLDATACVDMPDAGEWRVWVRSRKWTEGAGAFKVCVGGSLLSRTFGVSQSEWGWEDGGTVRYQQDQPRKDFDCYLQV